MSRNKCQKDVKVDFLKISGENWTDFYAEINKQVKLSKLNILLEVFQVYSRRKRQIWRK